MRSLGRIGRSHPRHDPVRRRDRSLLDPRRAREEVGDAQLGRVESVRPSTRALDLEMPRDPLEPAHAPGLAKDVETALHRRRQAPARRSPRRASRCRRCAARGAAAVCRSGRPGRGRSARPTDTRRADRCRSYSRRVQPVARPDRSEREHQPHQHAGEQQPAGAEQCSDDDDDERDGRAGAHGSGRSRAGAASTGGTATDPRTPSITPSTVDPRSWRSMSSRIRCPSTAGTSALTSSGRAKSRPARYADACVARYRATLDRGLPPSRTSGRSRVARTRSTM